MVSMSRMSPDEHRELPLAKAARLRGLRVANVAARTEEELIRTHPATRGAAKRLVWLDEFDEDIAALRCKCGCGRPVSNASRWYDQGCSRRKYPVETRICPVCDEDFELLGCYAQRDRQGEPCCSDTCEAKYRWRGGPEAFGRLAKGGTWTTCAEPGCHKRFYRYPSRPNQRFCPEHVDKARAAYHDSDAAKTHHEEGKKRLSEWHRDGFSAKVKVLKDERGAIDTGRIAAVLQDRTAPERRRQLRSSAAAVASYWIGKRGAPAQKVFIGERRYIWLADAREIAEWWLQETGDTATFGKLAPELAPAGIVGRHDLRPPLTQSQRKQIHWLIGIGCPQREVAERVGCSRAQLRYELRKTPLG
jgi:hypothetical protein